MKLYRVFPWDANAAVDTPGGALFAPIRGAGRFDNPELYRAFYLSLTPEAAVGERFSMLARWRKETFIERGLPLSLATVDVPDDLPIIDLNRVSELTHHHISLVTTVATRERSVTQNLAARLHTIGDNAGLRWWSLYVPEWTNVIIWDQTRRTLAITPDPLSTSHPAVTLAATTLPRTLLL